MRGRHREFHKGERIGWLRAAVLGANDGTISVASLVVGVAASGASTGSVLVTGVAGLVAGAMSMAAGEYVSVHSQADAERADLAKEKRELEEQPDRELAELTAIYVARGLDRPLAQQVAAKLMSGDALAAHARDELGITETQRARPLQAAFASAVAFVVGAIVPIATVLLAPKDRVGEVTSAVALVTLAVAGGVAAHAGGAPVLRGAVRVAFWGAAAMAITAGIGKAFGTSV
ncbi:MAG TPA: VIT family protein [Xanthomonadales bacterium]|nr:VIT family protein [Xanthomonadales bacterium]